MSTVLILGAGLAGLSAARELTRLGHTVQLLDKGRGLGGRLATRRLTNGRGDHGAQYFSARSSEFQTLTTEMRAAGLVHEWHLEQSDPASFQHPRYVGTQGMNSLAKYLATGLSVQTGQKAVRITPADTGWAVQTEAGETHKADALLLTMPAPQALALCDESGLTLTPNNRETLSAIQYEPCLALLVQLSGPTNVPEPGGLKPAPQNPVSWLADNRQKGISPEAAVLTIHASHTYSQAHLDDTDLAALVPELLSAIHPYFSPETIVDQQIHRWRYSNATRRDANPYLAADLPAPLLFGGDGFGPGNVEGAFLSGLAMARFVAGV